MREFTVPPEVAISDAANLTDPVWANAEQYPDSVQFARRSDTGFTDVTCREFRDHVVALAQGLIAAGVGPGQRVGLMSRTRYEWTLIDYAIWSAGAVTVPIYETSSPEQVQWILSDAGCVAVWVETDVHYGHVAAVRDGAPELRHVWQIDPRDDQGGRGGVDAVVALGAAVDAAEVDFRRHTAKANDLATIIYTSGTTGRPKGCLLTHRNIYSDIANALPGLDELFHSGSSTLLFLPLAHSFARLIQVGVVQARVRTAHTPDTRNLVEDMQAFQPSFVLAVPRVFEKVYNTAKQRAHADGKGAIFDRAERTAIGPGSC